MVCLGIDFFIYFDCEIYEVFFGCFVEIGKGSRIMNLIIGDYFYCDCYVDIVNVDVGKFVNIVVFICIGVIDYLMYMVLMYYFLYWLSDYWDDVGCDEDFFVYCVLCCVIIGYDIWIGNGVMIKFEVMVGIGVVVVFGVVVIKDVVFFMIVVGMLVVKICDCYMFVIIEWLMVLVWWDWDYD